MTNRPRYHHVVARQPEKIMRAVRVSLMLSQNEIAKRLGVSTSHISMLERGHATISAIFWFHFCELVHISGNAVSIGYCKHLYMARVRAAIRDGTFGLPVHPKLLISLERFYRLEQRRTAEMERLIFNGF